MLNSEGSLPKHAEQIEAMIQAKVDADHRRMGKPIEADAQFKAAKEAGIPVITVVSGTSPHALFDIQVNEYKVGARGGAVSARKMNYQGKILDRRFEQNVASRIRGKVLDVVLSENPAVKVLGQPLDGAHRELARRRAQRHAGADPAEQGQVPGHLGVVRRAGLHHRRPAARAGLQEGRRLAGLAWMAARRPTAASRTRSDPARHRGDSVRGDGQEAVDALDKIVVKKQPRQVVQRPVHVHGRGAGRCVQRQAVQQVDEACLSLAGIRKRYGAVEALRGVDLDVEAGEVLAICGDNGAGKSSLIRVVSGAHEPTRGTIEIDGAVARFARRMTR